MYKSFLKAIIDFFLALIGLILLSPFFMVISAFIGIKLGAPILYKQERPGLNGKPFFLYKFRSMTNQKDENGNLLSNEQRLNAFGKKLRSTSLDELPSLFNVLKGEMSIVGPRPLRLRYMCLFTNEQDRRHNVKPGITGYAQVNGRSNLNWDKKFELDVYYVDHMSFWLDVRIIFKTLINVIAKKDTKPKESDFEIPFDEYVKLRDNG